MVQSSIFTLKFYKFGIYQGEIHIRPSPALHLCDDWANIVSNLQRISAVILTK